MLERLIVVFAAGAGLAAVWLLLRWYGSRMRRQVNQELSKRGLASLIYEGKPAVLYFWSEHCAQCGIQAKALDAIRADLNGAVHIAKVNALEQGELASEFRIFTVPSTVVMDDTGQVRAVNYGYTAESKLRRQLDRTEAKHSPRNTSVVERLGL